MNVPTRLLTALAAAAVAAAVAAALSGCAGTIQPGPNSGAADAFASSRAKLAEAEALEAAGDAPGAIRAYGEALKLDRNIPAAWHNLGILLQAEGNNAGAAEAYNAAAELDPRDPRPLTALGLLAQELEALEEAGRFYDQALERDPNYLPALKKAVQIDALQDRYDDRTLQRARKAVLLETDPKWREELIRIQLKAQERVKRSGGSVGPA